MAYMCCKYVLDITQTKYGIHFCGFNVLMQGQGIMTEHFLISHCYHVVLRDMYNSIC